MIGTITSIYDGECPTRTPTRKSKAVLKYSSGSIPRRSCDIIFWRKARPAADNRPWSLHYDPRRPAASHSIRTCTHNRR